MYCKKKRQNQGENYPKDAEADLIDAYQSAEESEVLLGNKKSTKNAKGGGTIRKRSDGRWEGRYSVGFDTRTGKQIQRSIYGTSQKEVREKLTKVTAEIDDGSYLEPLKESVGEWLLVWLETYVAVSVKPYTRNSYESVCRRFLIPSLGRIRLTELAAPQIQRMYNRLLMERGLSPKTIKNVHGILHRALTQAVKLGMIRSNPADMCDLPRARRKEIKPMEQEDIAVFSRPFRAIPTSICFW